MQAYIQRLPHVRSPPRPRPLRAPRRPLPSAGSLSQKVTHPASLKARAEPSTEWADRQCTVMLSTHTASKTTRCPCLGGVHGRAPPPEPRSVQCARGPQPPATCRNSLCVRGAASQGTVASGHQAMQGPGFGSSRISESVMHTWRGVPVTFSDQPSRRTAHCSRQWAPRRPPRLPRCATTVAASRHSGSAPAIGQARGRARARWDARLVMPVPL